MDTTESKSAASRVNSVQRQNTYIHTYIHRHTHTHTHNRLKERGIEGQFGPAALQAAANLHAQKEAAKQQASNPKQPSQSSSGAKHTTSQTNSGTKSNNSSNNGGNRKSTSPLRSNVGSLLNQSMTWMGMKGSASPPSSQSPIRKSSQVPKSSSQTPAKTPPQPTYSPPPQKQLLQQSVSPGSHAQMGPNGLIIPGLQGSQYGSPASAPPNSNGYNPYGQGPGNSQFGSPASVPPGNNGVYSPYPQNGPGNANYGSPQPSMSYSQPMQVPLNIVYSNPQKAAPPPQFRL